MAARVTSISQGWGWKERDASIASVLDELNPDSYGAKAAAFPSEVHVELLKAGRIPDPFKGFNEHEVQCESAILFFARKARLYAGLLVAGVGETEWLYYTSFDVSDSERNWRNAELVFEGLDTICDVYLVRIVSSLSSVIRLPC